MRPATGPAGGRRKRLSAHDEHSNLYPFHACPLRKTGLYLEASSSSGKDSNMRIIIASMAFRTIYSTFIINIGMFLYPQTSGRPHAEGLRLAAALSVNCEAWIADAIIDATTPAA